MRSLTEYPSGHISLYVIVEAMKCQHDLRFNHYDRVSLNQISSFSCSVASSETCRLSTLSSYIYCISSNPLQCPTVLKHFFLLQMGGTLWLEPSCTCVHAQMVAITESFCPTYQCFCTLWLGHKCQDVSGRVSKRSIKALSKSSLCQCCSK